MPVDENVLVFRVVLEHGGHGVVVVAGGVVGVDVVLGTVAVGGRRARPLDAATLPVGSVEPQVVMI